MLMMGLKAPGPWERGRCVLLRSGWVPRLWEPGPGHPAAKIITGPGGGSSGGEGMGETVMPDPTDHFKPPPHTQLVPAQDQNTPTTRVCRSGKRLTERPDFRKLAASTRAREAHREELEGGEEKRERETGRETEGGGGGGRGGSYFITFL